MLSWLAKQMIARNMRSVSAGDAGPLLKMDAKDIRFRFPGNNSWSTELEGKEELAAWLGRFTDVGIQIEAHEVILKGFPWKQTICVRGRSYLDSPSGERVYDNRYVIWGRIAWGLLREYEVYEDTEKSSELDVYLAGVNKL
jgi:ketosteroid isomerase-like protein